MGKDLFYLDALQKKQIIGYAVALKVRLLY